MRKGLHAHPYITEEITVCFATNDREKENYLKYAENAIRHFDRIFGVNDGDTALFSFGMNKEEKRNLMGAIGFAKAGGLAEYTRRADAAEAKIN